MLEEVVLVVNMMDCLSTEAVFFVSLISDEKLNVLMINETYEGDRDIKTAPWRRCHV